ncbi:MAG: pyruvate kinase [Marinilabiliales bacterium]
MINYHSRTKIIATIGPASSSIETLEQMVRKGIDVCRLNFSHSSYENHLEIINNVRILNKKLNTNIALLADLQGPKLRIGEVENNGVQINPGDIIRFVNQDCVGNKERVYMSYKEFPQDVKPGDTILIDDGKLKLEVIDTNNIDTVSAKVVFGGILSSRKGVNLPNTKISLPCLTEKDLKDLHFALENDVNWIALSFVRVATDILDVKSIIKKHHKHVRVIAKIEKPEALQNIDEIIDLTDAIMIARGDLGVEIPFEQVPVEQKRIVEKCISASKPVIIATQMMESMIQNFSPTRAEATDVANAVCDGADAVMLSGETSVGKYPVKVIESMQKIINYAEDNVYNFFRFPQSIDFTQTFMPDSICLNACKLAQQANAKAIITFTYTGYTTIKVSSYRPKAQIFAFTSNESLLCKLPLIWGVRGYYFDKYDNIDNAINYTIDFLKNQGLLKHEDIVIHVGSIPLNERGQTNMLKISYV